MKAPCNFIQFRLSANVLVLHQCGGYRPPLCKPPPQKNNPAFSCRLITRKEINCCMSYYWYLCIELYKHQNCLKRMKRRTHVFSPSIIDGGFFCLLFISLSNKTNILAAGSWLKTRALQFLTVALLLAACTQWLELVRFFTSRWWELGCLSVASSSMH